jgi:hypothetical protein
MLAIPAVPPSVRVARRWVADVLEEVGRDDLVESARLGVSELVTNALLHADPPVTIRVRGTVEHPRVEVSDQSLEPPCRAPESTHDELLQTFGRGLDLVASHSEKWGSDINFHRDGKTVWFEPAPEAHSPDQVPGQLFDVDEALRERPAPGPADRLLTIRLLDMPPLLFGQLRAHFAELGREVRLLSLSEPDKHPVAAELAQLFLDVEHQRRQARGTDRLDEAMRLGLESVDLEYQVVPTAPATMTRAGELLEDLYVGEDRGLLLTTRPPTEVLALQRWYLGQFASQAVGEPPAPWHGPRSLSDDASA